MKTSRTSLKDIYTGKIYADEEVLKAAPHNKGKIEFFSVGKYISAKDLESDQKHLEAEMDRPLIR